jgi:hypothetical protein
MKIKTRTLTKVERMEVLFCGLDQRINEFNAKFVGVCNLLGIAFTEAKFGETYAYFIDAAKSMATRTKEK